MRAHVPWHMPRKTTLDCFISLMYPLRHYMFNSEIRKLLLQVVSSWQVWAVTVVLVIYVFLINYVARLYRRRYRAPMIPKIKKVKPAKNQENAEKAAASESDDMELDEEVKEK